MARLVMKFGGTSVADLDRIRNVARHVKREVDAGHDVAVVVSAMAGVTNQLVEWCSQAAMLHDAREYDAVVATGEEVTAGLLAIVLEGMGVNARSWQGWQLPILTSNAHAAARVLDVNGAELVKRFKERHEVAVLAGFQGMHKETGRITTLGRGGSDTSAVAIAAAIAAERCDIYTDVDGVYTSDPRVVPRAQRLERVAYEEMLELASLAPRSCRCARSSLEWCIMCASSCDRASRSPRTSIRTGRRPERSSAARRRSWNSKSSPASPSRRTRHRSRSDRKSTRLNSSHLG